MNPGQAAVRLAHRIEPYWLPPDQRTVTRLKLRSTNETQAAEAVPGTGSFASPRRNPAQALRLTAAVCGFALIGYLGYKAIPKRPESGRRLEGEVLSTKRVLFGKPGPWGEIQYVRINIEMPDHFVTAHQIVQDETRWFFRGHTEDEVRNLFRHAMLTPLQLRSVLDGARWERPTNAVVVIPSRELVLELSPQSRAYIYSVLSGFPENFTQAFPYSFRGNGLSDWMANSGLSAANEKLVRQLFYRRGSSILFSDLPEVLPQLSSVAERIRLVKTLTRRSTVLMSLHVRPGADVTPLVNYWGKAGRAKDLQPLLQSLAQLPDGGDLDIAHLLPPFARKRLYTYPQPADTRGSSMPDCHYTSLNFFNDPVSINYGGFDEFRKTVDSDYHRVEGKPSYGDIFLFVRDGKEVLHSAVYVADDTLFTKNGGSPREPWVLMTLEDLKSVYPDEKPVEVVVLRHKGT